MKSPQATSRACLALVIAAFAVPAYGTVGVRVIVENRAPDDGTWLTPVWVGFQNGNFDLYDPNVPASDELERLAEDGDPGPLSDRFALQMPGGVDGWIGTGPIAPGESVERTFVLDNNDPQIRYFTYATMVIPSNDAFVALENPTSRVIFDGFGSFLGAFITIGGDDVLDAGTEVNDEIPEHTAFFGQTEPDSGVDEFSVVHAHPGYLAPGSGGILDDPMFAGADFTAPGYEIARIAIVRSDTVVSSGPVYGTWDRDGSPYLLQGDVVVPYGETLTIEPGVQVVSLCDCRIVVEGTLLAIGTEDQPIVFTKDSSIAEWHGLHFFYTSGLSRLSHCIVEYGAADDAAPDDQGGGIYAELASLAIDHSIIRYNYAYAGGGIYCELSELTVDDSQIIDNEALYGAGIACYHSQAVLHGNEITDNDAVAYAFSVSGGGLRLSYTDALLVNNNISHNQAFVEDVYDPGHARGGGLAVYGRALVTLIGNRITNNLAHAAYEYGSTAYGAGLYCSEAELVLSHNTIADNVAEALPEWNESHGGGLYALSYGGSVTIHDTILWGDAPQEISAVNEYGRVDIWVDYSDVEGGEGAVEMTPNNELHWLPGNIERDPAFVDPGGDDYHLADDSPCIDAGDPASFPDPDGTITDIGAFPVVQEGSLLADFDGDLDVDRVDYARFAECVAGPDATTPPFACPAEDFAQSDLDGDLDADLFDQALFQEAFTDSQTGACCVRGDCLEIPAYECSRLDGIDYGADTQCVDIACDQWTYKNITESTTGYWQAGAGVSVADDMTLVGSGERRLYHYELLVGAWEGDPYECTAELWTGCPGDGGEPIAGTARTWTDVPLLQLVLLEADVDLVEIPETVWMVVTFNSDYAGWFVADEAEFGYTQDIYGEDVDPWSCTEVIPDDEYFRYYSGFWAVLRCR